MTSPGSGADNYDTASLASSEASSIYARSNATPSRSLNARRLRMAADNDVQFLANRLAKLKLEEFKAHKEIDRTRSKTNEVFILSQRSIPYTPILFLFSLRVAKALRAGWG